MKRKLNDRNIPEGTPQQVGSVARPAEATFENIGFDERLLQGIIKEQWRSPTPVQASAIPLALEGKDILVRSKTGSGKTAAYVLPILQTILKRQKENQNHQETTALILVPTRELAAQVSSVVKSLSTFCGSSIRVENLTKKESEEVQRARLSERPNIVVATPARAYTHITNSSLSLEELVHLVIDEADLVLSYGYNEDLLNIAKSVPKGVQKFLMSATLSSDLDTLKGLYCRNPVLLEMDESEKSHSENLTQYVVNCAEDEKFLLVYAIYKLRLIRGKSIIFVGDIDRCYRIKLFLQQFGVKACVLNSELPVTCRIHTVEQFNKNVYDIIIATDEDEMLGSVEPGYKEAGGEASVADEREEIGGTCGDDASGRPKKRRRRGKTDYGVSRGVDFTNVNCLINFDLPTTSKSYTHRIGRTARAGKPGMALSFVIPKENYRKHKPTTFPTCEHDEEVLAKIVRSQNKKGRQVLPYHFDMKKLEGFRYRFADALRAITRIAVREARLSELRQEILNSEKLRRHFEENPEEIQHLKHDQDVKATIHELPWLKHVPNYLLPNGGKKTIAQKDVGIVSFQKSGENRIRRARGQNQLKGKRKKPLGRKADPLKTLSAKRRR